MTAPDRAYDEAVRGVSCRVAESTATSDNELAWQARWFSGACGREFKARNGETIFVTDFGEWNREAGPDFVRATVQIGGDERRGAIEVDLDPQGWEQHRHSINPEYENVILHVVVRSSGREHFTRTASHREVQRVYLDDHQFTEAEWSGGAVARPGHCLAPLRRLTVEQLTDLLAIACRRRLENKGRALQTMIASRGASAALFEALATALGYKHNKLPFQLLAQRVPASKAATDRGEALLFGLAGFLEKPDPPTGIARKEVAALWSAWWKIRAVNLGAVLPRQAWRLAGLRPANHPLRRLGALVAAARCWKSVRASLQSGNLPRLEKTLSALEHPFWSFHTTWNSPRRKHPLALIGPDRIRDIWANISLPLAVARGEDPSWQDTPSGPANATLRVVSARLFGGPLPVSIPKRMFVHQGLLQIYADFCQRDQSECAQCGFPSLVGRLTE